MAPVIAQVTMTLRLDALSGKPRLRQPSHAEPRHAEQAAGEVLRCGFFREEIMDRGMFHARHRCDVQLIELVAAEHAARDVADGHADATIDGSVRSVADEIAGDELRVPDTP